MIKKMLSTLIVLFITMGILTVEAHEKNALPELVLSAKGEIKALPDLANITLGVTTEENTADLAMQKNRDIMKRVFKMLKQQGIEKKDIQTSGLTLDPRYTYPKNNAKPVLTGYHVSNMVYVTIRKLNQIGSIVDLAVDAGATNIQSINFGIENPENILNEARRLAVQKLIEKAKLYAEAGNFKLGKILKMSESNSYHSPIQPVAKAALAYSRQAEYSPTPIAAGEVVTKVTIHASFEIRQ